MHKHGIHMPLALPLDVKGPAWKLYEVSQDVGRQSTEAFNTALIMHTNSHIEIMCIAIHQGVYIWHCAATGQQCSQAQFLSVT